MSPGRRIALAGLLAVLVGIGALAKLRMRPASEEAVSVRCPDPVAGCSFVSGGKPGALRFSESPKVLQPFTLSVQAEGLDRAEAAFSMAGMDMGVNRYRLQQQPRGEWTAKVILPVCVTGRSDWLLNLTLDGRSVRIQFSAEK